MPWTSLSSPLLLIHSTEASPFYDMTTGLLGRDWHLKLLDGLTDKAFVCSTNRCVDRYSPKRDLKSHARMQLTRYRKFAVVSQLLLAHLIWNR